MSTSKNKTMPQNRMIFRKILLACLTAFIALILPAVIFQNSGLLDSNPAYQHLVQSIFVGMIAVLGIWLFRSKLDKGVPVFIGLTKPSKAILHALLGFGLILAPLGLTLVISRLFGWVDFSFNTSGVLPILIVGAASTFFTDALTEELIYRGYIYSNLKERFNVWISSLITLFLFIITIVIIMTFQNLFDISGAAVPLSVNYILTLLFFGAFMQYLRVTFKTIWVGAGFHLVFVHMNQIMGMTNDKLIQFSETSYNEKPIQITLITLILLVFVALVLFPLIRNKRKGNIEKL
jgi:membrane protease YdiL (CAAX protease family)